MELHSQKENIIPQGIENLGSKKTPKSTRKVQIFQETEYKDLKDSQDLEIERLKQKCKEAEERTEEWKKKFKSQADTFRDNFDTFKNIKLENQKLSHELAELKNLKQSDTQLQEQIKNLKLKIQELSEDTEKNKKHNLALENRELKGQIEKMNKLYEDMFEIEQLERKWYTLLTSTNQLLVDERKNFKEKEEKYISNIQTLCSELESLSFKVNDFQSKEQELQTQLKESVIKEKEVIKENIELSQLVLYLQERIQALEQKEIEFNSTFQENQALKETIQEKSKEISNLQERMIGLSDEVSHFKEKFKSEQEKYLKLSSENQILIQQNETTQKYLNEKEIILQNLNVNQTEKEKEILETWTLIQQKLSEMEKRQEVFNRTERNLKTLSQRHEELIEFSDQERKIREEYIQSIQDELERDKKEKENALKSEEELKLKLNECCTHIILLDEELSRHKVLNSELEQDNLEKSKSIKTNLALIQDLEKSLMDSKTLNYKIGKFINENCKLCGINGDNEDPISKVGELMKSYNFLKEQQHKLVKVLEEMQRAIVILEDKVKEKDSINEKMFKEYNEQINQHKIQIQEQYEKELLKQGNIDEEMKLLQNQNQQLLKSNQDLETNLSNTTQELERLSKSKNDLEKTLSEVIHTIKKMKKESSSNSSEVDKTLFEKVVARSEYLETVTYEMNLEIATLQREKKELSLRMEILLLEKYKQINGAELLLQLEESKTLTTELEQKVQTYYDEIQKYKKEQVSFKEYIKNYKEKSSEKISKLQDAYEKSKLKLEGLNLILCKSKQIFEKYFNDPLCQEVVNLLKDK